MANLLDQLAAMTVVVADTGDIDAIRQFTPRDATTNPSLILAAAQIPAYQNLIDRSLQESRAVIGPEAPAEEVVNEALDEICVTFGKEILQIVPGRVSTEVDARLSYDTEATVAKAHKLIGLYEQAGVGRERVLIKIASTWEGIRAARTARARGHPLQPHPAVRLHPGRGRRRGRRDPDLPLRGAHPRLVQEVHRPGPLPGPEDPGVLSVTRIFNYFKTYGYRTEVMGASFRNIDEILELAGCDLLTISPALLDQLRSTQGELPRRLHALDPGPADERIHLDEALFRQQLAEDPMASEKLEEGIRGFSKAIETLEAQLAHRLAVLEGGAAFTHAVQEIFLLNDLDGDGCITREEWLGSDAVFDALDTDKRRSPRPGGRAWRPRGTAGPEPLSADGGRELLGLPLTGGGQDRRHCGAAALSSVNALDTMRALASTGEVISVPEGELIFRSGESGDCMFGLLEGTVAAQLERRHRPRGDSGGRRVRRRCPRHLRPPPLRQRPRPHPLPAAGDEPREVPVRGAGIADVRHRTARLDRSTPPPPQGLHQDLTSAPLQQQPPDHPLGDVAVAHRAREDLGDPLRRRGALDAQLIPHAGEAVETPGRSGVPRPSILPTRPAGGGVLRQGAALARQPAIQAGGGPVAAQQGRPKSFRQKGVAEGGGISHRHHPVAVEAVVAVPDPQASPRRSPAAGSSPRLGSIRSSTA